MTMAKAWAEAQPTVSSAKRSVGRCQVSARAGQPCRLAVGSFHDVLSQATATSHCNI